MIQLYIENDDDDDNHCEKLPVDSKHQHPPAHHVPKYQHGQIVKLSIERICSSVFDNRLEYDSNMVWEHYQIVPIFNDTQTIPIYVFPTCLAEQEVIYTAKFVSGLIWWECAVFSKPLVATMESWNQNKGLPVWENRDHPSGKGLPGSKFLLIIVQCSIVMAWHGKILRCT